jgi:hypothetical protein
MGRLVVANNRVPLTDPFAFTPTLPKWIDHEWLSGLIFYAIAQGFSDAGLVLLKLILAITSVSCIVALFFRSGKPTPSSVLWLILCVLHSSAAWTSTVRCQAFTYLFLPILYLIVQDYRTSRRKLLLAISPILAIAWVNMHGGYTLGVITLGILTLTSRGGRLFPALILGLWCLAPAFTPYGITVFSKYLVHALHMERPSIAEWFPLWSDSPTLVATVALTLPVVAGAIVYKGPRDLFALAMIAFSAYCAVRHIRFVPFLMLTVVGLGSPYFETSMERVASSLKEFSLKLSRATALSIALVACGLGTSATWNVVSGVAFRLTYSSMPFAAIEWLRASGLKGSLLVDFNSGSLALWRLYPNFKISVDGRYEEVYPDQTLLDTQRAFSPNTPEGTKALERLNPAFILLPKELALGGFNNTFKAPWKVIYQDPVAAVLTRQPLDMKPITVLHDETTSPRDPWHPLF